MDGWMIHPSIHQSIHQSINQSINPWIYGLMNGWMDLWLCGVVVDAWTRDLMAPGSNPPSATQSLFYGKWYLHIFPHPTHVQSEYQTVGSVVSCYCYSCYLRIIQCPLQELLLFKNYSVSPPRVLVI